MLTLLIDVTYLLGKLAEE